jgi:hypothetical protein
VAGDVELTYLTGWRWRSELVTRTWAKHVSFSANGVLRLDPGETKNGLG